MQRRRSLNWIVLSLFVLAGTGLFPARSSMAAQVDSQAHGLLPPGINVAIGQPVTASSETSAEPATYAVDGDPALHWCPAAGSASAQLTVDLGAQQRINGTGITWVGQSPQNYTLEMSSNGSQWQQFPATRSGGSSLTSFDFADHVVAARYIRLSFSGSPAAPCVAEFRVYATTSEANRLARGVDLSTLRALEAAGRTFSDAQGTRPAEQILADNGANLVRLRLWVNPPNGFNDLADVSAMALRIKQAHMAFLLDIHYSDFWADPGQQNTPAAWQGQDLPTLANTVREYTRSVITTLGDQGTLPDIVQIGNEVTAGMLWPVGKLYVGSQQHWVEFTTLLKAGIAGVHDAAPNNGPAIMIHIDRGGDPGGSQWFYDHMRDYGVEYDMIGLSYYPYWHGPLSNVRTNLDNLAARYGKPIMIVETAYPWTLQDHDNHPNIIGPSTWLPPEYPPTPEGQALFVRDLLSLVARTPDNLGRGIVYWEPAWIPGVGWAPGQGDAWDNQTFFDENGNALPSIDALQVEPHENRGGSIFTVQTAR